MKDTAKLDTQTVEHSRIGTLGTHLTGGLVGQSGCDFGTELQSYSQ
jgi:hypothetical protein